jgi:hypothetical protein
MVQNPMNTVTRLISGAALAAGLTLAGFASAQERSATSTADEIEFLSLEDMDSMAGGDAVTTAVITEQTLNAVNTGNAVIGDVVGSGQISLGSGAFSGYNGLGNFVINTGHNNNLQSSMSVSVVLPPDTP